MRKRVIIKFRDNPADGTKALPRRLYKVLKFNYSATITGFNYQSYLPPKRGVPGRWLRVRGKLEVCKNGLHVTSDPYMWGNPSNCNLYIVEVGKGKVMTFSSADDKFCCRAIRLVRKVKWPRLK